MIPLNNTLKMTGLEIEDRSLDTKDYEQEVRMGRK